jgi:hypothetical protein
MLASAWPVLQRCTWCAVEHVTKILHLLFELVHEFYIGQHRSPGQRMEALGGDLSTRSAPSYLPCYCWDKVSHPAQLRGVPTLTSGANMQQHMHCNADVVNSSMGLSTCNRPGGIQAMSAHITRKRIPATIDAQYSLKPAPTTS